MSSETPGFVARPVARPLWAVESGQACRSADAGLAEGGEAVSPGKHASAANLVVHESMDVPQQRPLHEAAVHWLRNMPTRLESEFRTAMQAPVQTSNIHKSPKQHPKIAKATSKHR